MNARSTKEDAAREHVAEGNQSSTVSKQRSAIHAEQAQPKDGQCDGRRMHP